MFLLVRMMGEAEELEDDKVKNLELMNDSTESNINPQSNGEKITSDDFNGDRQSDDNAKLAKVKINKNHLDIFLNSILFSSNDMAKMLQIKK